eukprot:EG_transcript_61620
MSFVVRIQVAIAPGASVTGAQLHGLFAGLNVPLLPELEALLHEWIAGHAPMDGGNPGPPPIDPAELELLRGAERCLRRADLGEDHTCVVCMQDFEDGERGLSLPCRHT